MAREGNGIENYGSQPDQSQQPSELQPTLIHCHLHECTGMRFLDMQILQSVHFIGSSTSQVCIYLQIPLYGIVLSCIAPCLSFLEIVYTKAEIKCQTTSRMRGHFAI